MEADFSNVYADTERARAYAQLDFPGTYQLAFRDLPALLQRHVRGTRALDFGCGAGRSTRLLERLGYRTVGVDIAPAMLAEARRIDPAGDYRLITPDDDLTGLVGACDLVLAAFTFDNIPTDAAKSGALHELRRLLAPAGRVAVIVSTPEIYRYEWTSFSTRDFPGNQDARDGDRVRVVMLDGPDRRPVEDVLCSDTHYRELFAPADLHVLEQIQPLGTADDGIAWVTETRIAPWSIYLLGSGS